jgi:curved DNA-binding protein CbpA
VLQDFKDYYSRLDITFTATEAEIKAAYRKMARENHPDMHPEETEFYTEQFQEITEAYETLSDPIRKGNYDFRYRQLVLHEGPQYEYYVDETPENNTVYEHKYTSRNRKSFSYFPAAALLIFGFQFLRMIFDAAPIEDKKPNGTVQPILTAPANINGAYKNEPASLSDSVSLPFSNAPFLEKAKH